MLTLGTLGQVCRCVFTELSLEATGTSFLIFGLVPLLGAVEKPWEALSAQPATQDSNRSEWNWRSLGDAL